MFKLKLENPMGGATLTSKKMAVVHLTNDDELMQTISKLQASNRVVRERNVGKMFISASQICHRSRR